MKISKFNQKLERKKHRVNKNYFQAFITKGSMNKQMKMRENN
jgi:hypothetical protein